MEDNGRFRRGAASWEWMDALLISQLESYHSSSHLTEDGGGDVTNYPRKQVGGGCPANSMESGGLGLPHPV